MSDDVPAVNSDRFKPLSVETIVRVCLFASKSATTLKVLQSRLKKLVPEKQTDAIVAELLEARHVSLEKNLILTAAGNAEAERELGNDVSAKWEAIWKIRLPMLALGLDPNAKAERLRFSRPDALKAAIIATAFGLPRQDMTNAKVVASELVWRILRARARDVVGDGPFGTIEKPGPVERVILGGLCATSAKTFPDAINMLAAKAVGLTRATPDELRQALIAASVAVASGRTVLADALTRSANGSSFAAHVLSVAKSLSTPPFMGRVAIASVYDAYGKAHSDAGSLASFKERLIRAAEDGALHLARLDMPERMAKPLRQRSETAWMNDQVHFVVTNWK